MRMRLLKKQPGATVRVGKRGKIMDAVVRVPTVRSEAERIQLTSDVLRKMPSMKSYALSLCHDASRAEDLVQETVLRAMQNANLFDGSNLGGWLFTILHNIFRSEYRKRRRETTFEPEIIEKMQSTTIFAREAESAHDLNKLLMCMALLPEEQRDALIAVGYLGLEYDEAARTLGCVVGTIKSRVNRARNSLMRNMHEDQIRQLDVSALRCATSGVPKKHPYYQIAAAYADLYAECHDVKDGAFVRGSLKKVVVLDDSEKLWQELVASGALEEDSPSNIQGAEY